ncbi:hypothetical protein FSP39_005989 [Pinctada imbricata]|uniref:Uncharacterized protein n=1 Tax=Pinctada imbricata TaxID=66713 RepID=A0AA88YMN2_PINIB|nr:hypothetical protein FSP39_005989 [Pinctada imbricata]
MDTHQYRRVAIIALIAILCFVIGVLIGYFSMKKEHLKYCKDENKKSSYPANFKFLNRGADMSISKKIPGLVSRERLDETLRFLTDKPRKAGTENQAEVTKFVHNTFLRHGFDSERVAYNVLLSYPRPGVNTTVTLLDEKDNELLKTSPIEEDLENINNDDESFKAYNGYSPSGDVEGDLIYAEYGRKRDFEKLKENGIDVTGKIVIIKYGKIFRGNKVDFAARAGAVGVILFSDPGDYGVCCEGTDPYPKSGFLPLTGMQRGNIVLQKGDQTTPGYPSTKYAYRLNEVELKERLPSIPSQPIAAKDAFKLIRELKGQEIVQDSLGRFNLSFPHGTGLKLGRRVKLVVKSIDEMRKIENVIGTIKGSIEPDRYVIFGGHKDAWVYGAADPMSGSNTLLEVSRVIGELVNQGYHFFMLFIMSSPFLNAGWKPRRSIIICSWDAEEYGLVGSYEWVEAADPDGNYDSVYDKWLVEENGTIKAKTMGGGSDFVPFLAVNGIPTMYPKFYGLSMDNKGQEWTSRSTPLYHSRYETYNLLKMIDPEMKFSAAISTILVEVLRQLADSLILPFDLQAFLEDLKDSVKIVLDTVYIQNSAIDEKYKDGLQKGIERVEESIAKFENHIVAIDTDNPLAIRRINDKLVGLEKVFLDGNGLPDRPWFKHLLRSPSSINYYGGSSFPGIGALYDVYSKNKTETNRRQLEKHLSDEYSNDADSAKFDNLNKGPDNSISKKIPGLVSRQRLDETLRFLTEKPRYAGTENQADVTNFVHNTFLKHGFYSEKVSYNVLLSYPLPAANTTITLLDDNGNELYQTSPYEEDVEGLNADNNNDSFKAFNAFSPSGVVEGDLIYAGYARKSDFEKLKDNGVDVTGKIVIAKYGKIFRGNKVDSAAKAGAVGVILYSDPADYGVCCEGINPYPESAYLPLTGIQRGNDILKKGDQTTPGYPSTKYAYRMYEDELKVRLPSIPSQPIAANDAFRIIRYVIFGGHKDAYVYGAADPMSGTNVLLEVSRVIGELIKQGWRPRRSIIICSWDAEEYGLMGSYEWVEVFKTAFFIDTKTIQVNYLNLMQTYQRVC